MFDSIPQATRQLLIINTLIFVAQTLNVGGLGDWLGMNGALHYVLSPYFHIYQPLTYMFLHGGFEHLLFNMLALWMFGRSVEPALGTRRFVTYYFVCGIGAALCQELWQTAELFLWGGQLAPTVGASGAIYGVLLAFGMLFPNDRIMLLIPPIPMKAKVFVFVYALLEVYMAFSTNDNVAHLAHLGGMFFGWLMFRYWRRKAHTNLRMQQRYAPQRPASATPPPAPPSIDQVYNARRQRQEAELDALLDKIRQSGYDSLTEEEKRKLFKG